MASASAWRSRRKASNMDDRAQTAGSLEEDSPMAADNRSEADTPTAAVVDILVAAAGIQEAAAGTRTAAAVDILAVAEGIPAAVADIRGAEVAAGIPVAAAVRPHPNLRPSTTPDRADFPSP